MNHWVIVYYTMYGNNDHLATNKTSQYIIKNYAAIHHQNSPYPGPRHLPCLLLLARYKHFHMI